MIFDYITKRYIDDVILILFPKVKNDETQRGDSGKVVGLNMSNIR